MRYYYELNDDRKGVPTYGANLTIASIPTIISGTLYEIGDRGLILIQQFLLDNCALWAAIDERLVDDIYLQENFKAFFNTYATEPDKDGLYPIIPVRKAMHKLKMKPLPKERWETTFDRMIV